jgi:transcription antitermination factor NusG
MHWALITTHPQQEDKVCANLCRQGFLFYFPRFRRKARIVALFPRYMFVGIDGAWYALRSTFGVSRVIMRGDTPDIVPHAVIENLIDRESGGLVRVDPSPRFRPGQKLITRNAHHIFSGHDMIYQEMSGSERVRVLLSIMGRSTSVELEAAELIVA